MELMKRSKRSRSQRLWLTALAVPVIVGAAAIASADVEKTWAPGETLTAADLNATFEGLDDDIASLAQRIAALEETPTYLISASEVREGSPNPGEAFVYQAASVTLTPGTWLVEGSATVSTTVGPDSTQIALWDEGAGEEIQGSRSPVAVSMPFPGSTTCSGPYSDCLPVAHRTSIVISVAANTTIKMRAIQNGTSRVWIGPAGPLLVLPTNNRITALKLR